MEAVAAAIQLPPETCWSLWNYYKEPETYMGLRRLLTTPYSYRAIPETQKMEGVNMPELLWVSGPDYV